MLGMSGALPPLPTHLHSEQRGSFALPLHFINCMNLVASKLDFFNLREKYV